MKIDQVTVRIVKGKVSFEIPSEMTAAKFKKWKFKNHDEINSFIYENTEEVVPEFIPVENTFDIETSLPKDKWHVRAISECQKLNLIPSKDMLFTINNRLFKFTFPSSAAKLSSLESHI